MTVGHKANNSRGKRIELIKFAFTCVLQRYALYARNAALCFMASSANAPGRRKESRKWTRQKAAASFAIVLTALASIEARTAEDRPKAATEGSTVPYRFPSIDPAKELTGAALLAALKKGGFVLYMRHTQAGTVTPECEHSNLSPAGERDARFVGESIKTLRIPIGRVLSSPVCRVLDTAKLMGLGEPTLSNDLANQPMPAGFDLESARDWLIGELPPRDGLRPQVLQTPESLHPIQ